MNNEATAAKIVAIIDRELVGLRADRLAALMVGDQTTARRIAEGITDRMRARKIYAA